MFHFEHDDTQGLGDLEYPIMDLSNCIVAAAETEGLAEKIVAMLNEGVSREKPPAHKWAATSWAVGDVESLRPDWTKERCEAFLDRNGKYLADACVRAGWEAMEALIFEDESEEAQRAEKGD